LFDFIVF
jgi:hypothetical protein